MMINRSTRVVLPIVAGLVWLCNPAAVARQTLQLNFSGIWTALPDPTPATPRKPDELNATLDWTAPVTLTQTATTLTVEYQTGSRSHAQRKFVYNLDGSETRNVLTGAVDPTARASTAAWRGQTLVLTDAVDWPDRAAGTTTRRLDRKALTLEPSDVLRVDATLILGSRTSPPTVRRFKRAQGR